MGLRLKHWVRALGTACLFPSLASATDLLETFRRAQHKDETYLSALASHRMSQELIPQALANLLPSASFSALRMNNQLDKNDGNGPLPTQVYGSNNRTLGVRQSLWRPVANAQLEQSKFQTIGAYHDLMRSQNELALRTVSAYLDALYAEDQRKSSQAQVQLLKTQLEAATLALQQGYGTRTELDEIQARMAQAQAEVLQFQSSRAYALEQLSLFSGVTDPEPLSVLQESLPISMELPNLSYWINQGFQDNPEASLSRMKVEASKQEIVKSKAGHLPTLDLVAQVSNSSNENVQFPSVSYINRQIGIQLNIPLFSGGATQSSMRQSLAQTQRDEHLLNATLINNRLQITREYANVTDGRAKILANTSAHKAALQTLVSTEKNQAAGYKTRLDVLNSIQRLATAEKELMLSRYQTLLAWLKLQLYGGVAAEEAISNLQRR